ncbi:hypothetical protein PUN28_010673 [Cardiocondyla obscurior]|uniref:Secreted protein n=1 Tax=Cardiocondyla obscurior TaxID=286306 RepID=A0AAW2FM81_9HYME
MSLHPAAFMTALCFFTMRIITIIFQALATTLSELIRVEKTRAILRIFFAQACPSVFLFSHREAAKKRREPKLKFQG